MLKSFLPLLDKINTKKPPGIVPGRVLGESQTFTRGDVPYKGSSWAISTPENDKFVKDTGFGIISDKPASPAPATKHNPKKGVYEGVYIGVPGQKGNYADNPNHLNVLTSIYNSLPDMKDTPGIQAEITRVAPGSPITGDMVKKAADKYEVSPRLLISVMRTDSQIGTDGKSIRTKNVGNVGNTTDGGTKKFERWEDGLDAMAKLLSDRKKWN